MMDYSEYETKLELKATESPTSSVAYLEGEIELILHSKVAQSLLKGSHQHGKRGLWDFAVQVRELWLRHRADDPYADWYFMKIDKKVYDIRKEINVIQAHCEERLAKMRGLNIAVFRNPTPLKCSLRFMTPFGYSAAALLPELDYIACQAYTLRHIGQWLEPQYLPIRVYYQIRDLFSLPSNYKITVTRKDIIENNDVAKQAKEKIGEVPADILSKEGKFIDLLNIMLNNTYR